ncbi:MAG: pilus assembly protein FimV [Pseudomonadota bacterium]|nr:pilus assembly protein FimV [Pseudomonadota bacterium]
MKTETKRTGRLALKQIAAAAAMMAVIGTMTPASALSLGRLSVQSALGETLRADIDVTSLTPDEAANLRVRVAPPDAYRIAGVDYNPVLPSTAVTLQRRADGTPYLRVTSERPVQEPFVDVILELSWSSGRLLREYTLLFDPPATAKSPASPPTPAAVAAAPMPAPVAPPVRPSRTEAPAVAEPAPRGEPRRAEAPAAAADAASKPAARRAAPPAVPAPSETSDKSAGGQYTVRPGDTLSGIAARLQVSGVSLDQMLVGLYQGNSQAFAGNNMNRLKAGAVLTVPPQDKLTGLDERQARHLIQVQSANFNAYRQRLASAVPEQTRDAEPARRASGEVRAGVEVKSGSATPAPDVLKVDKGVTAKSPSTAADEKKLNELATKEAANRASELKNNLDRLRELQAASASASVQNSPAPSGQGGGAAASAPAVAVPVTPPAAASAAAAVAKASEAIAAVTAPPQMASDPLLSALPASAPASEAAVAPSAPVAASRPPLPMESGPVEEPSLLDSLAENPLLLPGAGLIVAILAGLGYYRLRGRNKNEAGITSFLESRMQPDSFFGASGGQRVDTRDAGATGSPSSMSYSLSQIHEVGDVDPVAEADVYLAYGRDLQAEEILKEAMRTNPERLAIRTKLLEVYAKRRDTKGYEMLAGELFGLTAGQGEDWQRAQELGRSIDPENPLYEPGGQPGAGTSAHLQREPLGASTMPQSVVPSPTRFGAGSPAVPDLDLDAIVDAPAPSFSTPPARVSAPPPVVDEVDLDISQPAPMDGVPSTSGAYVSAADASFADSRQHDVGPDSGGHTIDFDLHDLPEISEPVAPAPVQTGKVDFDGLSLDFDLNPTQSPAMDSIVDEYPVLMDGSEEDGDPLARKIDLAKEFLDFGDKESARDMLQDVVERTDNADLKARARTMLDRLA